MLETTYLVAGEAAALDRYLDAQNQLPVELDDYNFIYDDGIEFSKVPTYKNTFILFGNWRKLSKLAENLTNNLMGYFESVESAEFDLHLRHKKQSHFCVKMNKEIEEPVVEDMLLNAYQYIAWCDYTNQEPVNEFMF